MSERIELLRDLGAMIAREVELDELLGAFERRVAGAMRADRATLWLISATDGELRTRVATQTPPLRLPAGRGIAGHVARTGEAVNIPDVTRDDRWAPEIDQQTGYQTTSLLSVPVEDGKGRIRGVVQALNKDEGTFTRDDERFLADIADGIARALEYTSLRAADQPRGVPLRGPINHIVGGSPAMREVYDRALRAAATDATVLLHGETGTGKGLFARAIHVNSARGSGPFVHVDCTTLPAGLVESELFGHERGAFTSADRRVLGKVETASGGTLFLDEIGELPLDAQGKLLRFLQERRFERVGGRETLDADVRIVAATNRDLAALVEKGTFRADLYWRIRVVDIEMPPLRARGAEDVLDLADHFLAVFTRRYRKPALRFSDAARRALAQHAWPGNVRELEHAVERAVVLAAGTELDAGDLGLGAARAAQTGGLEAGLALEEAMRRYALACLERHGGNRTAAAKELGIGRNRLARLLSSK